MHDKSISTHKHLQARFRQPLCYRFQLLLLQFESERLPHKAGSPQILGSRPGHQISPDVDGGVEVSVHEYHSFIAAD